MGYDFPANLARRVRAKWSMTPGGNDLAPLLPDQKRLQFLLEVAYLAGMETDEGRYLRFMLCCTPVGDDLQQQRFDRDVDMWPFVRDRSFRVQEVKRLATATDLDTAALWVQFSSDPEQPPMLHGLLNLGSSWARARNALSYQFTPLPEALFIRVPGPGRVLVYRGQTLVASLQSGRLQSGRFRSPIELLGAYPLFRDGHNLLRLQIAATQSEAAAQGDGLGWAEYVHTVLAIVNGIRLRGHGGAVIFAAQNSRLLEDRYVRIKYRRGVSTFPLKQRFLEFMRLRLRYGSISLASKVPSQPPAPVTGTQWVDFELRQAEHHLAEMCEFIANFSGVDGAIVLRTDLTVEGFGTEILLNKVQPAKVYKVDDPLRKERQEFDSEQFGMRHRSAMRLSTAVADLVVFVVSQDGVVSLVWNDEGQSCFKTGLKTTDVNMLVE